MSDRTELAMTAPIASRWLQDGSEMEVCCPVPPCSWTRAWEFEPVTLAGVADAVQQHLTLDHRIL